MFAVEPVWAGGGVGLCHGECAGPDVSVADSTGRWAHDCLERHRFPCRGGRSEQSQTVSAGRVAGPPAGRDGALDADPGQPFEAGDASGLGVFSGAPGVHHGRLQCAGPVAWLPAQRVGLRASLDS